MVNVGTDILKKQQCYKYKLPNCHKRINNFKNERQDSAVRVQPWTFNAQKAVEFLD